MSPERYTPSFESLLNMFEKTLSHEQFITGCINELCELAVTEKDHASQIFLQWFVTEQIEEENNDRDLIAKLKLVGDNGHGILMIDSELGHMASGPEHAKWGPVLREFLAPLLPH